MDGPGPGGEAPRTAFLLAGASNLRLLYPALSAALLAACAPPAAVHVACGIGRSYFLKAGVPWRRTPAVGASGALEAFLDGSRPGARAALVMDMGNDILYGLPLAAQVSPLATLVGRLARAGVPTLVVPPQADPARIGAARFALVRALYYPKSRVALPEALASLRAVRACIDRLEGGPVRVERGLARLLSPDLIHFSPRAWREVARALAVPLLEAAGLPAAPAHRPSPLAALFATPFRPRLSWVFGREEKSSGAVETAPGKWIRMY